MQEQQESQTAAAEEANNHNNNLLDMTFVTTTTTTPATAAQTNTSTNSSLNDFGSTMTSPNTPSAVSVTPPPQLQHSESTASSVLNESDFFSCKDNDSPTSPFSNNGEDNTMTDAAANGSFTNGDSATTKDDNDETPHGDAQQVNHEEQPTASMVQQQLDSTTTTAQQEQEEPTDLLLFAALQAPTTTAASEEQQQQQPPSLETVNDDKATNTEQDLLFDLSTTPDEAAAAATFNNGLLPPTATTSESVVTTCVDSDTAAAPSQPSEPQTTLGDSPPVSNVIEETLKEASLAIEKQMFEEAAPQQEPSAATPAVNEQDLLFAPSTSTTMPLEEATVNESVPSVDTAASDAAEPQQPLETVPQTAPIDSPPPVSSETRVVEDTLVEASSVSSSAAAETLPGEKTIFEEEAPQQEPTVDPKATDGEADLPEPQQEEMNDSNEPAAPTMVPIPDMVQRTRSAPAKEITENDDDNVALIELQFQVQEHLSQRQEAENRAQRAQERIQELESAARAKEQSFENKIKELEASLASMTSDRDHLDLELVKLRQARDEFERKEIVLSNRLNAAKKKEAAKANLAEQLQDSVKALQQQIDETKSTLSTKTHDKTNLEQELALTKSQYGERLETAEHALAEERRLNEDRKKKMKAFVESKQEELRQAKAHGEELTLELSQTNRSLREHHARWKQLHAQWVQSQTRNRELQRDLNKIKKESENQHKKGDKMEWQMAKSAQETEEHKNKRLTAKHELMTVLRTLEIEREVSGKLRDSIKFTFTPKALSQQQLMKESLRDFERELEQLSRRLGRPLPPAQDRPELFTLTEDGEEPGDETDSGGGGDDDEHDGGRQSRSEIDTSHLLSNLEHETQRVSQCIMALTNSIERMHVVLDESGERSCVSVLSDLLSAAGSRSSVVNTSEDETSSMTPRPGLGRRYGQVPS